MRTALFSCLALAACATDPKDEAVGFDRFERFDVKSYGDEKPDNATPTEAWSSQDDPSLFDSNLEYDVDALPLTGEAESIPWAGAYWPVYKDSINHRWDGTDTLSPAEKYAEAFGVPNFPDVVSEQHGIEKYSNRTECEDNDACNSDIAEVCAKRDGEEKGYCIPTWWGICHAWAPVAILEAEPEQAVTVNDVEFKVQDIKALLTLAYNRTRSRFVSLRCNEDDSQDEIEYDEYDRPTGDDEECRDTNPGTYHVLVTNFLGLKGQSFVEDRTMDVEVWNQPIRGYRITKMDPVSVERANELVGVSEDEEPTESISGTFSFDGEVASGEWIHKGPYTIEPGAEVAIEMLGTQGDADLYVRVGETPTENDYDCRPYKPHSNESCDLTASEGQTELFVSVRGYSDAEFEVEVQITDADGSPGDSATVDYAFNDEAEAFFHVKLEVDYLIESHAGTDGNLAERIDDYTRTDRYQYVLEVDADNRIIGGEWIGSSKKNHPDFLWLPTERSNWPPPASGSLNWDLVKDLLDQSMIEEEPEIADGAASSTVEESFSVARAEWRHFGPYTVEGALKATLTGTNDADLYVREGSQPTTDQYACRPYSSHSNEDCAVEGPGEFYVSVRGYSQADVELRIEFEDADDVAATEEAEESGFTHLDEIASVDFHEMALYVLELEAGDAITVKTIAENDIDLYVRFENPPTKNDYDARGYTTSGNERIDFDAHEAGTLHIGVHGYEAGDYRLTTASR